MDLDEAVKHAKRYESYTHCTKVNTDNEQGHYNKDGGRVRAVSNGKGEPKVNSVASVGPSLAEYQAVLNELRAFRESRQSAPMVMPPAIGQSLMQVAQGPWQAPMYPPHGSYPGHIPNTPVNNQQTHDQVNWHAQNYYNNNKNYNNNGAVGGASGTRGGVCFSCKQPGHWKSACPNRRGTVQTVDHAFASRTRLDTNGLLARELNSQVSRQLYIELEIHGVRHSCLLDSGCDQTVAPIGMVKGLRLNSTAKKLYVANGTRIPIKG